MNNIYIQDIVDELITFLKLKPDTINFKIQLSYSTVLWDVLDYIEEFKVNINYVSYAIMGNEFKSKLYET